jgi:hypothetical protein
VENLGDWPARRRVELARLYDETYGAGVAAALGFDFNPVVLTAVTR